MDFENAPISFSDFELEEQKAVDLAVSPARKLDNQLHVQFYKHAELNAAASKEAGRKIFDEHVYVRIMSPANRLAVIERRASDDDKLRFAHHYSRFLQGLEQLASGTPIDELPSISPSQALELRALKIATVEQLAEMPDTTAQLMGVGGGELKLRARRYLDERTSSVAQAEANRDLQRQLAEAMDRIAKLEAQPSAEIKVTAQAAKGA